MQARDITNVKPFVPDALVVVSVVDSIVESVVDSVVESTVVSVVDESSNSTSILSLNEIETNPAASLYCT